MFVYGKVHDRVGKSQYFTGIKYKSWYNVRRGIMAYAFAEFNMLEKGDNNLDGSSLLILFCMGFFYWRWLWLLLYGYFEVSQPGWVNLLIGPRF